MKKFLTLVTVLLLSVLAACNTSDVSTGSEGNSVEKKEEATTEATESTEETQEDTGKLVDATSQSVTVLGLKVGLGEIMIAEDNISVGVNLENTSDKTLSFYPDQGQLVVGDMQLDANLFLTVGDIGGDVHSGVKQDAVIEFPVPEGKSIDVNAVTDIRLIFGDVMTDDFMNSEPVEFNLLIE